MSKVVVTRRKTTADVQAETLRLAGKINAGAAQVAAEYARAVCPVSDDPKPVHLRDTIRAEVNEQTGEAMMIAGDPEQGIDYAPEVEFGHFTNNGTHVPGRFFFTQGEAAGREEAKRLAEVLKPKG
jgi:hypothetical protein